jgi:ElaB/YqjD/DUF883 family membrane-anchored ribosome-binding protein
MPEMHRKSATSQDTIPDIYALIQQLADIREDLQGLTSMVGRVAGTQLGRAKDTAAETASQAEEAIRQNPISALAIAMVLGFLFGMFMRR